jgi:hypothetical protein
MSTRGFVGYRYKGQVHGWYNHSDSYCGWLGRQVVDHLYKLSQEQLKDFFLKRLTLVYDEEAYAGHKNLWDGEFDFSKDSVILKDAGEFYKDGLFCEYSYIFDLDSKQKRLLLFTGFGKKPAKGYEDWFYRADFYRADYNDKTYYVRYRGSLTGDTHPAIAYAKMAMKIDGMSKEKQKVIRKVLTCPCDEIPRYLAEEEGLANEVAAARLAA